MTGRRYVVLGAGVVGVAVADELTARGATDVTVLDKGPLYATGGSSSHAPGLVSRTSPSKMMQALLFFTFGFFGLHTLLWLVRSLKGDSPLARPAGDDADV